MRGDDGEGREGSDAHASKADANVLVASLLIAVVPRRMFIVGIVEGDLLRIGGEVGRDAGHPARDLGPRLQVIAPEERHELLLHVAQRHDRSLRDVRADERGRHLLDLQNSSQERHLRGRVVHAELAQVRDALELAHLGAGGVKPREHEFVRSFGVLEDVHDRSRAERVERPQHRKGRGSRREWNRARGWTRADRDPRRTGRRWILHLSQRAFPLPPHVLRASTRLRVPVGPASETDVRIGINRGGVVKSLVPPRVAARRASPRSARRPAPTHRTRSTAARSREPWARVREAGGRCASARRPRRRATSAPPPPPTTTTRALSRKSDAKRTRLDDRTSAKPPPVGGVDPADVDRKTAAVLEKKGFAAAAVARALEAVAPTADDAATSFNEQKRRRTAAAQAWLERHAELYELPRGMLEDVKARRAGSSGADGGAGARDGDDDAEEDDENRDISERAKGLIAKGLLPIHEAYVLRNQKSTAPAGEHARTAPAAAGTAGAGAQDRSRTGKSLRAQRIEKAERDAADLCRHVATGARCPHGDSCTRVHDANAWMRRKPADLPGRCPFARGGSPCPYGLRCRRPRRTEKKKKAATRAETGRTPGVTRTRRRAGMRSRAVPPRRGLANPR